MQQHLADKLKKMEELGKVNKIKEDDKGALIEKTCREFMYTKDGKPFTVKECCEHECCKQSHDPDKMEEYIIQEMTPDRTDIAKGVENVKGVGCLRDS